MDEDNVRAINGAKIDPVYPLFNGELRLKVQELVGADVLPKLESTICDHLILSLKQLGQKIGTAIADKFALKLGFKDE